LEQAAREVAKSVENENLRSALELLGKNVLSKAKR